MASNSDTISNSQITNTRNQRPYTQDLLTIDPTEPTISQAPIEPSVPEQYETRQDLTLSTLDAQALTSFLPALKKVVSSESFRRIYEKLQAVQISSLHPAIAPSLPTSNASAAVDKNPARTSPGRLANAVQMDQKQWSEKVATGRIGDSDCIFGEHIHQSSFGIRHTPEARRVSPSSPVSSTSLTEQIQRLTLNGTEPPLATPGELSTKTAPTLKSEPLITTIPAQKRYATRNPFRSFSPTSESGYNSSAESFLAGSRGHVCQLGQLNINCRDGTNLRLPDFLRSSVADEDVGAAARAQYGLNSDAYEEAVHYGSSQDKPGPVASLNGAEIKETKSGHGGQGISNLERCDG